MDTLEYVMPTIKKMILDYFKHPALDALESFEIRNWRANLEKMTVNGTLEKACLIAYECFKDCKFDEKLTEYTGEPVFKVSRYLYSFSKTTDRVVFQASAETMIINLQKLNYSIKLTILDPVNFNISNFKTLYHEMNVNIDKVNEKIEELGLKDQVQVTSCIY